MKTINRGVNDVNELEAEKMTKRKGGREELEGDQWPMASVLIKRACVMKPFLKSWF